VVHAALSSLQRRKSADADDLSFSFHRDDEDHRVVRDYDSNIMGRFICDNRDCATGAWSSKMIAITIRMYPNKEYIARVYHQRCRGCNRVGRPILDESYAERVAYRLKKWSRIDVETPFTQVRAKGRMRAICARAARMDVVAKGSGCED